MRIYICDLCGNEIKGYETGEQKRPENEYGHPENREITHFCVDCSYLFYNKEIKIVEDGKQQTEG